MKIFILDEVENSREYFGKLDCFLARQGDETVFCDFSELQREMSAVDSDEALIICNSSEEILQYIADEGLYACIAINFDKVDEDEKSNLKSFCVENSNIGWIDTAREMEFHLPFIRTFIGPTKERDGNKILANAQKKFGKITEDVLVELSRIKHIYEELVPLRIEKMKGLTISSKYSAGEAAGGEFFDIVDGDHGFMVFLSDTNSYVVSSVVLSHFEILKEKGRYTTEDIRKFVLSLSEALAEMDFTGKDPKDLLQLFIGVVDLKRMSMDGVSFGGTELISNKNKYHAGNDYWVSDSFMDQASYNFSFDRGEKISLLSPGVRKNCGDFLNKEDLVSYIRGCIPKGRREFLDEVFYQLKKDTRGNFLPFDAAVLLIEVDENVIVQV